MESEKSKHNSALTGAIICAGIGGYIFGKYSQTDAWVFGIVFIGMAVVMALLAWQLK